ncbi:hypothetical protein UlMin_023756 [Ulmus minor]
MLGAVQLGMLAAFVVVLFPMGMAGWHLSRNKMLFFSGALFITLTIGVHLTPYFPSVSDFVSFVSSAVVVFDCPRHSCISLLHNVVWNSWDWEAFPPVLGCEFRKLTHLEASELMNGSFVALSLLSLLLDLNRVESVKLDLFRRHSDYHIVLGEIGMRLDFVWAPYTLNLTNLVVGLREIKTPLMYKI